MPTLEALAEEVQAIQIRLSDAIASESKFLTDLNVAVSCWVPLSPSYAHSAVLGWVRGGPNWQLVIQQSGGAGWVSLWDVSLPMQSQAVLAFPRLREELRGKLEHIVSLHGTGDK